MNRSQIENIEIDLLLEGIFKRYGHDFRHYSKASIARRIQKVLAASGGRNISELIPRLLYDEAFWNEMVLNFSINVSDMFRDPPFFSSLAENVLPLLRTYPALKIWHAGCSTGEEVYSLAILLKEASLYERCTIFATDFNDAVLNNAKDGIFPIADAKEWSANYLKGGGTRSFSNYYHADNNYIKMDAALKKRITFANHNLVTDGSFGEMNLIICRNVLIYFDRKLQNRVLKLFCDSLGNGGFLGLGSKESINFSEYHDTFEPIDKRWKIFKKKPGA